MQSSLHIGHLLQGADTGLTPIAFAVLAGPPNIEFGGFFVPVKVIVMTVATEEILWVTPRVLERLRGELADLTSVVRPDSEQGHRVEMRIRELEGALKNAQLGEKPDDGLVEPGMQVTVTFAAGSESETFLLGSRSLNYAMRNWLRTQTWNLTSTRRRHL